MGEFFKAEIRKTLNNPVIIAYQYTVQMMESSGDSNFDWHYFVYENAREYGMFSSWTVKL